MSPTNSLRIRLASSVCDVLATVDYGYGKGVHPKDRVPRQKPHPHCLCYLIPVTRRKGMRRRKERLDKETLKKIAPQYVRDLEALGVDIEKLWDKELNVFVRKRELVERIGQEEFKVIQTVGRTVRAGRWKGKAKTEYIVSDLLDIFETENNFPSKIVGLLSKSELDSLTVHYIKRKYVDGWELDSPEALDRMFTEHIKNPEVLIYQQGNRYALELGRYVAIVHPPDTKISIFRLRDRYRDYEDYAEQTGRPIIKLWQLKHILRKL